MREICYLRKQQRNDILRGTEVQSTVAIGVDGVEYGGVLRIVRGQCVLQFLCVLVKVEVDSAIVSGCLVYQNVVEVVPQSLHANDSQCRYVVVYDVLPTHLALDYICPDDVNDVVAYVEQFYEVFKLLLNQVLLMRFKFLGYVRIEVQSYELAS